MRVKRIHFMMIGDGYGVLSALIKRGFPNSALVLVDLGKTLVFQAYGCQRAYRELTHTHVNQVNDLSGEDFVYCPAEQVEALERYKFDVAVNITSMQEMNSETAGRYFSLLRRTLRRENRFYCCNREYKVMSGGEVSAMEEYPWSREDDFLIDEPCPWHRYFFSLYRAERGPKLLGLRIPLANYYDGRHRHRLARLAVK